MKLKSCGRISAKPEPLPKKGDAAIAWLSLEWVLLDKVQECIRLGKRPPQPTPVSESSVDVRQAADLILFASYRRKITIGDRQLYWDEKKGLEVLNLREVNRPLSAKEMEFWF